MPSNKVSYFLEMNLHKSTNFNFLTNPKDTIINSVLQTISEKYKNTYNILFMDEIRPINDLHLTNGKFDQSYIALIPSNVNFLFSLNPRVSLSLNEVKIHRFFEILQLLISYTIKTLLPKTSRRFSVEYYRKMVGFKFRTFFVVDRVIEGPPCSRSHSSALQAAKMFPVYMQISVDFDAAQKQMAPRLASLWRSVVNSQHRESVFRHVKKTCYFLKMSKKICPL